jgi:hypothetical protein
MNCPATVSIKSFAGTAATALAAFFSAPGSFAFLDFILGHPRHLPRGLKVDCGILANSEFAGLASMPIADRPTAFAAWLNNEIEAAHAAVRDLPSRRSRLDFFDG